MRPSSHRRRRALASSFLVTVAACGSAQPPSDPPELTANPPRPELPPEGAPGMLDAAAPDAPHDAGATAAQDEGGPLPQPEQGGRVVRNEDGTCSQYFPDPCPTASPDGGRPIVVSCNPPPPQRVACPPESGKR